MNFWARINAAATQAARNARGKSDGALRRDWRTKQATRGAKHVSVSEVRTLGTGYERAQ